MSYLVDFHTHSIVSQDGGITVRDYTHILENKTLDYIAVTDHNEISRAIALQSQLGDHIIIGEEITTIAGEIIGLYLTQKIAFGLSLTETIQQIKAQNGLVYVPHPFEINRHGLQYEDLERHHAVLDIIEVFNGRGWGRGKASAAQEFATKYAIPIVSSSDAHSASGVGKAYTILSEAPTRDNLIAQLKTAELVMRYSSLGAYLSPTVNRLKKKFGIIHDR